jgi:hypothetical protein
MRRQQRQLHQAVRRHLGREVRVPARVLHLVVLRVHAFGAAVEASAAQPRVGLVVVVQDRPALAVGEDLGPWKDTHCIAPGRYMPEVKRRALSHTGSGSTLYSPRQSVSRSARKSRPLEAAGTPA